ncbi:MAG TPA: CHASE domain-containing protein, partial [Motiliproteus sp.]
MRNSLILLLLALIIDLALESLFSVQHRKEQELVVIEQLSTLRARIEGVLNANLHLVSGVSTALSLNPELSNEDFSRLAAKVFTHENQLRNIAAAPDLMIRYIYPLEGNAAAIGLNYNDNPNQREAALRARDSGKMVVAGPVNLVQGGSGLVARLPVFVDQADGSQRFWGLVSTVLDTDRLYERAGLMSLSRSIKIAIRGKNSLGPLGEVFFGDPQLFDQDPVLLDVSLPTGSWQIAAKPLQGWEVPKSERWLVRLSVFMFTVLGGLALMLRVRQIRQRQLTDAKFSAAFNESPLGMAISSLPDAEVIEVNEAFEVLTRRTRQECLNQSLPVILRVQEQQRLLAEAQSTGHLHGVELESSDSEGQTLYWQYFSSRFDTPSGPHLLSLLQDVTEQKRLRKALELAKQVMDNTSDGVMIADRQQHIIEVNNAFTQITGYSREEAVGELTSIGRSGRHDDRFYESMWQQIHSEGRWSGE